MWINAMARRGDQPEERQAQCGKLNGCQNRLPERTEIHLTKIPLTFPGFSSRVWRGRVKGMNVGDQRLQILQRVRSFGGVGLRVHGDVADKLLADGCGGESPEIEPLVGQGLGKTRSLTGFVRPLDAQSVEAGRFPEASGARRGDLFASLDGSDEHDARAGFIRCPPRDDQFEIDPGRRQHLELNCQSTQSVIN